MKKLVSIVCLSAVSLSVLSQPVQDIRPLFVNEKAVQYLPKIVAKSTYSKSSAANKVVSSSPQADVVVFYQPSYVAKYGEFEAFKRISTWFDTVNASYQAHGFNYRLSIKDMVPVESIADDVPYQDVYGEDGEIIQDGADYLFSIAALNPGSPEYSIYQEKWKADLVVYIREERPEDTVLGLAGIGGEYSSVVDQDIAPEEFTTLAHEIGHNIGMNHEEAKANVGPEYARAWMCGGNYTIMYSASPSSETLHHYSSPELSSGDEACGDESVADNARVLDENFISTTQRREGEPSSGVVTFNEVSYLGSEEEGVWLSLQRDGDLSQSATVKIFAEDETAQFGLDYTDTFVLAEFAIGAAATQVLFPVVKDGESESTESFTAHLRYPYRLSVGTSSAATLSVTDGALVGNAGLFSISGSTDLNEGDVGGFSITRVGGTGEAVLNVKALAGSAVAGSDYVEFNKQLVFVEGDVEKTLQFITVNDIKAETTESLTIEINSPRESAEYNVKSVSVNILDDDVSLEPNGGTFGLGVSSTTVSEAIGNITVNITRSDGESGDAVLRVYTVEGSALEGTDFTAIDKEVLFSEGETEKTVLIPILDDSDDDVGSSTFNIMLEGAGVEVTTGELTITLTDNDNAPPVDDIVTETSSGGGAFSIYYLLMLIGGVVSRVRTLPTTNMKP